MSKHGKIGIAKVIKKEDNLDMSDTNKNEVLEKALDELFEKVQEAYSVLVKLCRLGVIESDGENFYYFQWIKDRKGEWYREQIPIATATFYIENTTGKYKLAGLRWNVNSPAALLAKLTEKHKEKLAKVSALK